MSSRGECGQVGVEHTESMIGYLQGMVRGKVLMTSAGVGYVVHTAEELPQGEEVSLHVTTIVREDSITLYGFLEELSQEVFSMLTKVSGVGPQLALALLHDVGAAGVVKAVLANDTTTLVKARGLGKKRAETLILALKDMPSGILDAINEDVPGLPGSFEQLVDTLENLGYDRSKAQEAVQAAHDTHPHDDESALLGAALHNLRSK